MTIATLLAASVFAVLVVVQANHQRAGLLEVADRDAPEVVATTDLYFALNDMDAQVANILLVGDDTDLGFTAAQAQAIFDRRRLQADTDLQQAAVAATDSATAATIRSVLDTYGQYQTLVARTLLLDSLHPHRAGQAAPVALAAYRLATDLLESTLLPAARTLGDRSAAALDATYQRQQDASAVLRTAAIVAAVAAVGLLVLLQVFLARRFRRRVNPAVVAATLTLAVLASAGLVRSSAEADHLQIAKKDAFDSILALDRARAVSYDANADESRYLVDPARAGQYQSSFLAKTLQLVNLPGAQIDTFDGQFATAIARYTTDHADIGWQGLYGTEFRNITFPGERAAAEKALTLFAVYQADDRRIRALASSGQLPAAIAFCTSYRPGQSNYAFDQYDQALTALIGINQTAFTANIADADADLHGWTVIPWLVLTAFALLLAAGAWRRFAEYW